ncbi:amino acid permease [Acetobacter syzygii]|uniref:amino acid permease n=1 Tax=Acetobacter syzygii TaxID=146476 RepID=UPI0039EB478B
MTSPPHTSPTSAPKTSQHNESRQNPPPPLATSLAGRHIAMISLGGVMGAGLFVGASGAIVTAGPAVLFSYALSAILVLLINLLLRDVALHAPGSGSFLNQIRTNLGLRIGFVAGWSYWLLWVVTLAIEVMAAATLLEPWVPLPYAVREILVLGSMTALNLLPVRNYGEFEYGFSCIKILALTVFIGVSFVLLYHYNVPVQANLMASGNLIPHGLTGVLAAVPTALFSMSGTEIATIAALESGAPDVNVIRTTRTVAFRLVVFYLLSIALILCLVPWTHIRQGESPFLYVLQTFHIPFATSAMTLVILVATLSTLNSGLYTTSRVLFEMAGRRDAPRYFLRTQPKTCLPVISVLACSLAALVVSICAVVSPGSVFAFLVSTTGAIIMFNNGLMVFSRMRVCRIALWRPWLALALLTLVILSMLALPDTRKELLLGAAGLAIINIAAFVVIPGKRPRLSHVLRDQQPD